MYRIRSVNPVFMRLFRTKKFSPFGRPVLYSDRSQSESCLWSYRSNSFWKCVTEARLAQGMKQVELLAKLQLAGIDISVPALPLLEGQKRPVSDIELNALADILNVSVDWLLGREWKNAVDASCAHTDGDVYFMSCFSLKKARNPESKTPGKSLKFPVFWKSIFRNYPRGYPPRHFRPLHFTLKS